MARSFRQREHYITRTPPGAGYASVQRVIAADMTIM